MGALLSKWTKGMRPGSLPRAAVLFTAILLFLSVGCEGRSYTRYRREFYDLFDTATIVIVYAERERDFEKYYGAIFDEMQRLNRLYDIYNDYDGISNIKTINDNAGLSPVTVDPSIIDLLREAKLACERTGGLANAAMGSVLRIWHDYRGRGISKPEAAELPPMSLLDDASLHTDMDGVEIDEELNTVFLRDPKMSLDVGAFAKGYAVQLAVEKAKAAGMTSGLISAGGNVAAVGKPMDGRDKWSVGIRNPDALADGDSSLFDTVEVNDMSAVTSGDYERFYVVDGVSYSHIIDPATKMPARLYKSVTVIHPDSGRADMLSTALFILPQAEGEALAGEFGAEALWILPDNSAVMTSGYRAISSLD